MTEACFSNNHSPNLCSQTSILNKSQSAQPIDSSNTSQDSQHTKQKTLKKKIQKDFQLSNKKNSGHWTPEEHQIYVRFLEEHITSNQYNQQSRKNNKIFKLMAETIGTRSPSQCRSHHQKFNPFSAAGQKRIKRNRKRTNTENQINVNSCDIAIKLPLTPHVKANIQQLEAQPIQFICQQQDFSGQQYRFPYYDDSQSQGQAHFGDEQISDIQEEAQGEESHVGEEVQPNQQFYAKGEDEVLDDYFNFNKANYCSYSVQNEVNVWFQ